MNRKIHTFLVLAIISLSSLLKAQSNYVLSLNGTSDYVQVPQLTTSATNTITIEGWIKPSGIQASWSGIYVCRNTATTFGLMFRNNNELGYMWEDANGTRWGWSSGLTVPADQWSHVALIITPTNATVYLNGAIATQTKNCNAFVLNSANIGYDATSSTRLFKGQINNIRVWNVSKTASELAGNSTTKLPSGTANLLADYRFDTQTANDFSGNGKNAVLTGCSFVASDAAFETALSFNGTSDYGTLPRFFSSDPTTFTIEWWFNPTSNSYRQSLSGGGTGYGWGAFWFVANADGSAQVGTNLDGSYLGNLIPAGTIEYNKWQHLTFSLSGGVGKFYKNGILIATKTGMTAPKNFTKLDLGCISSGASYYLKGMLDDIKIWSSERSVDDIATDMYTKTTPQAELKGYWNFNSKVPGALADSSGNAMNGALTGGTYMGYVRPKFYISCDSILQKPALQTKTSPGAKNVLLEKIHVYVTNSGSSLKPESLILDFAGTTNTEDISNVNLYYANGIADGLNTSSKIASFTLSSPRVTVPINNLSLTQNSTFWITADISAAATAGNLLKSTCKKLSFPNLTAIPKDTTATATTALTLLPELAYTPNEKSTGIIRNPGMGLSIYLEGYSGIFKTSRPKYDNGLKYPDLFWHVLDSIGATAKASVLYIRLPWSAFEPIEGQYIWNNNSNYQSLIQGARDRGLKLAFRAYFDSGDSYQQATPDWVRTAGANGYTSNPSAWDSLGHAIPAWNPYYNDVVFLQKVRNFINAFGAKYNDPSVVEYIDANGLGLWGEGNSQMYFDSKQANGNRDWVFRTIAAYYRAAFPHILLGVQNVSETDATTINLTRTVTDIYRRDSFGSSSWLPASNKVFFASEVSKGFPVFAENAWNAFNPIVKPTYYKDWGFATVRDMIKADYNDVRDSRANSADFRIPSDAEIWMRNPDLVDSLVNNLGYRFVPSNLFIDNKISKNDSLHFYSTWKNTGWGCFPNARPAWHRKYKLAFALLDGSSQVKRIFFSNAEMAEVLKGSLYNYQAAGSVRDLPNGTYTLGYAIVDSMNNYQPAVNLAIMDTPASSGWYTFGEITISNSNTGVSRTTISNNPISCLPKPVKKQLTIRSEIPVRSIKLVDIHGIVFFQKQIPADILSGYQLNMENYPCGTYVLVLEGEDAKTYTTKVIKQ